MKTMKIKVVYLGVVRHKVGKKEEEYELAEGSSVRDLLSRIVEVHGELKGIINGEGESPVDPTLIATLNNSTINLKSGSKIKLRNGDVLTLMTVIGGG